MSSFQSDLPRTRLENFARGGMWEAESQPWHRSSSRSRVSLTCSREFSSSLAPSLPFAASPEGMGQWELLEFGVDFDFRASLIFRELSPFPGIESGHFPVSLLFLTRTGRCPSRLHPRGRSLLFLRCPGRRVWDHPGCVREARGRFCLERSVCSGWDEGSGAAGMLQQEFQVGFAPGGCVPAA